MKKQKNTSLPARPEVAPVFNPLQYPTCFFSPAKVSDERSWQQHIPFAFALVQMLRPRTFVELGTHKGDSYLAFCQAVGALCLPTKCYAVDTWAGDQHADFYDETIYPELLAYHDKHYAGFSRLIRSTFDVAVGDFADASIDLLHIDGLHTYETVRHDFETWRPKLSTRAVVLFHNTALRVRGFSVWRYWDELREQFPSFTFDHCNGLGVLAVGRDSPAALAPLLALDKAGASATRYFFSYLGSRAVLADLNRGLQGELTTASAIAATRLQIFRSVVGGLDEALNSAGFAHPSLDPSADERTLGEHAAWVHRGLADLAAKLQQRDTNVAALAAQAQRLEAALNAEQASRRELAAQISALHQSVRDADGEFSPRSTDGESPADSNRAGFEPEHAQAGLELLRLAFEHKQAFTSRIVEEIRARESRIAELENEMREVQARIAEESRVRENRSAELENEMREAQARIAEEGRARESRIAELENEMREAQARIAEEGRARASRSAELENEMREAQARIAALDAGTRQRDEDLQAIRASWSWKITALLRLRRKPADPQRGGGFEQWLHRAFYALPGANAARKRELILWMHRHAGFLTRKTASYELRERALPGELQPATPGAVTPETATPGAGEVRREVAPRMSQQKADALISTWRDPPLISVALISIALTGDGDSDASHFRSAVDSVRRQFYPNWELCIADDASTDAAIRDALAALERENEPRIRIVRLPGKAGAAAAANSAIALARGEYVALLDRGDELTRDALLEMARAIVDQGPDFIYADEDRRDSDDVCRDPIYKPDYSPDYLLANNYIGRFAVLRAGLFDRVGRFREGFDGAQDFDLVLRATAQTKRIAHVPLVLHHARAGESPRSAEAGLQALEQRLALGDAGAHAEHGSFPSTYRVRYALRAEPLVSILIPFRDKPELLATCIRSIREKTDYGNYEIIGIDNGSADPATLELLRTLETEDSRVRFVRCELPFNYSAINNFGASHALGTHLLFLNNDTEVLTPEWLRSMLEYSQRDDVGVVGARLLYPDDTVQHAGVILDRVLVAMHHHKFVPSAHPGYAIRPHLPQNFSAVTFACAMSRREVFDRLGGLDESRLQICFNDVDYCLRAREAGYLVVYTPYAVLRHFESKSRGKDHSPEKLARLQAEFAYMQERHAAVLARGDPYYNPNFSPGVRWGFSTNPHYADELPS